MLALDGQLVNAYGLVWFPLSDEDAGESELPERPAAGCGGWAGG
jgi:hypothetical protein